MGLDTELPSLSFPCQDEQRSAQYRAVFDRLKLLLEGENDFVAAMATVACELHHAFGAYYHWTGFYRPAQNKPQELVIGPYQGHLGCLRIPYSKGVCGAAARTQQTQLVPNVAHFPGYIACAGSTQSEIVVPIVTPQGELLAVLDVDSDHPSAFTATDRAHLESICNWMGQQAGWSRMH